MNSIYSVSTIAIVGVLIIVATTFAVAANAPINTEGPVTQLWFDSNHDITSLQIDGSTNVSGSNNCIIPQTITIGSIIYLHRDNLLAGCAITVIKP